MAPRIVSLLPAATEIVGALGALEKLVGESHECDATATVTMLLRLTRPRAPLAGPKGPRWGQSVAK
jgi:iron complex transport system substrate-binding protein